MSRCVWVALLMGAFVIDDAEAKGKKNGKKGGETRELTMKAGTIQAGGSITADVYAGGGSTDLGLTVAPQGGYFVADQIELLAEVQLASLGGVTTWQIGAGGRYLVDLDPLWAYAGATVGYGQASLAGFSTDAVFVTVLPGVLYPLAKNVGLDLGARVQVASASGTTSIVIPVGYLGVQAFFK